MTNRMTIQEGRSHGQCSAPLFNPPRHQLCFYVFYSLSSISLLQQVQGLGKGMLIGKCLTGASGQRQICWIQLLHTSKDNNTLGNK